MSSSKNNQIYKKTSFLAGINSDFLDKYYSIYLTNPNKIPKDWKAFFDGLNEEIKIVSKIYQVQVGHQKRITKI